MIDTGNSFASEITNKFAKKLGFKPSQLLKSPTDQVKQAGNGAKLQIIGKLLENVLSDYFHFDGLNFKFKEVSSSFLNSTVAFKMVGKSFKKPAMSVPK